MENIELKNKLYEDFKGLSRAYAALYNYCKKKSFIEMWCIENAALVEEAVDVNELVVSKRGNLIIYCLRNRAKYKERL